MSQFWWIVNLDKRETFQYPQQLSGWLFNIPGYLLFSLGLAAKKHPKFPERDSVLYSIHSRVNPSPNFTRKVPQRCFILANFPAELLDEIFSHLDDLKDIIHTSLSCQDLWEIGRYEIYRRIVDIPTTLSWAGDRVICVGQHCPNSGLPKGLLTPKEQEEYAPYGSLVYYPFRVIDGEKRICHRTLYWLFDMESKISVENWRLFHSLVNWDFELPWVESTAVLRNLTRRRFVRGEAVIEWKTRTVVNRKERVGFNEIVLSRIGCSTDPFVGMGFAANLHRGAWAGDRFDFVECEWLEGLQEGNEGWVDVSEEVLEEIEVIWASQFGP
ncbi:hypothetical protein FB45DRAFT_29218 [Roridomyces roridus]|uniref:F-box domain-containing protein n=1 Tax=Roridomyces roridus TaxID=1738132 RepID=A0AAD7CKC1_9AGAR|nr:hypothetical protein FB45DRAFT_29218 [Roridomyces roridus]